MTESINSPAAETSPDPEAAPTVDEIGTVSTTEDLDADVDELTGEPLDDSDDPVNDAESAVHEPDLDPASDEGDQ